MSNKKKWKAVPIKSLFNRFIPGKCNKLNSLTKVQKGIPYIGATNRNNGVLCSLLENKDSKRLIQEGNCIGFIKDGDGSAGLSIYKKERFISTVNVIYGYAQWLNLYTGLFFVVAQDKIEKKYSHGYKRNQQHLRGDKVMLPTTDAGEPDFAYMGQYAKFKQQQMLARYRAFITKELEKLDYQDIPALSEKKWEEFKIEEIFNISAGKRLTKNDMVGGKIPFIGASDANNDITSYIGNINSSLDGNVLGVNYNGSVVNNFYHRYQCFFSDDVKRFSLKTGTGNQHLYLFLKTIILQQKIKYAYGYKFNEKRMKKQIILLPVNDTNKPDYNFMEQYAKNMMFKKYHQYLNFINAPSV